MKKRRGVAAHQRPGEGERAPAGLSEAARRDPLSRAARLVLVDLVDQPAETVEVQVDVGVPTKELEIG